MKSACKRIILVVCVLFFVSASVFTVSADNGSTIVYVTDSGEKYHSAGCRYLSRSQNSITLEDAVDNGYSPCSRCNPPVYDGGAVDVTPSTESKGSSYTVEDTEEIREKSEDESYWAPGATRIVWISDQTIHLPDCPKVEDVYVPMALGDIQKRYPPCDYCKPLQYMSMDDRLGVEEDRNNAIRIGFVVFLFLVMAYAAYTYGKKRQADAIDSDYDRISKELEDINSSMQKRFGHLRNPITGERIQDAKSYLRALDAQDIIRENKKAERETEEKNRNR